MHRRTSIVYLALWHFQLDERPGHCGCGCCEHNTTFTEQKARSQKMQDKNKGKEWSKNSFTRHFSCTLCLLLFCIGPLSTAGRRRDIKDCEFWEELKFRGTILISGNRTQRWNPAFVRFLLFLPFFCVFNYSYPIYAIYSVHLA